MRYIKRYARCKRAVCPKNGRIYILGSSPVSSPISSGDEVDGDSLDGVSLDGASLDDDSALLVCSELLETTELLDGVLFVLFVLVTVLGLAELVNETAFSNKLLDVSLDIMPDVSLTSPDISLDVEVLSVLPPSFEQREKTSIIMINSSIRMTTPPIIII